VSDDLIRSPAPQSADMIGSRAPQPADSIGSRAPQPADMIGSPALHPGDKEARASEYHIPDGSTWARAWKMAAGVGGLGAVCAVAGYLMDPRRFAFAYLMGFLTVLTMALGSTFFVLVQHLTGAGWSVTVRRASEFFVAGAIILPVLALPNLLSMGELYPWWQRSHEEPSHRDQGHEEQGHEVQGRDEIVAHAPQHGQANVRAGEPVERAAAAEHGKGQGPEHALHEATLEKKLGYLEPTFFIIRAMIYLLVWLWLSTRLFSYSTRQDENGDPRWTVKLQRMAPVATILFAFSLNFAGFDWFMSLEPNWYSTMFGVRLFATSAVLSFALNILVTLGFRSAGISKGAIHVEHFHDLGKLMFGFLVFWAYISFSEFFLIWYAAIPEETIYFHRRWDTDSWRMISVSLVVVKFIIPFFLIMSRNAKRNLGLLGLGAGCIALLHLVEMYYWVMPHFQEGGVALSLSGVITDLGCVLCCVGLYLAVVFRQMLNHPVIPVRDPRLRRAIDFVNA
jgi:hypothetical protein